MFDSPIAPCTAIREYVLTDQTQAQCAREHDCPPERVCPLHGYFVAAGADAANDEDPMTTKRRPVWAP